MMIGVGGWRKMGRSWSLIAGDGGKEREEDGTRSGPVSKGRTTDEAGATHCRCVA